ncbi:MAG: branched-chain amino acid ABC transporter permease [Solirubrobacteraceae bacterium]
MRPVPATGRSTTGAWGRYAAGMAALAVAAFVLGQDAYWLNLITVGLLFAGLASAWNIIGGFGGQFSLGHGVFFGVGAYTVALLQARHGWSPWLSLLPAAGIATLVAAALALPIFRLRGPFFAIGTLALNEVAFALANYFDFTGGPRGVSIPFQASLFPEPWKYAVLMFVFMAVVVAAALAIARSRLGYSLLAVREDEDAARAAGVNPLAVKTTGLLVSAAFTGIGGGLFALHVRFVDPPSLFELGEIGVRFPLLALIGGIGTIAGPVVGALLVQPGALYMRGELGSLGPGGHLIVLGALLILAAVFFKQGIVGTLAGLHLGRRLGALRGRRRR